MFPIADSTMDPELQKMEAELERMAPGSMPEGMISRMEAAMEGWKDVSWQDERLRWCLFLGLKKRASHRNKRVESLFGQRLLGWHCWVRLRAWW